MKRAIVPVYQPIVDIDTGIVLHYEALARVRNGVGQLERLIEAGEVVGFIDLIDIAMLEHVVEALHGNPCSVVAVNVSGATIDRSCNEILAVIFKNMEFMRRVVFEITETSEIRDLKMLDRFIRSVRLLNARVALDDFGTGYCTLKLVELTKPEFVKLSGDIVHKLDATGDVTAVREVCDLVRGNGGEIIAEHIDTKEKSDTLRALDIRYLQGFYVGGFFSELPGGDGIVGSNHPSMLPGSIRLVGRLNMSLGSNL